MLTYWACDGIGIRTWLRTSFLRVRLSPSPPTSNDEIGKRDSLKNYLMKVRILLRGPN
jgi:hypothetical protein